MKQLMTKFEFKLGGNTKKRFAQPVGVTNTSTVLLKKM